MANIAVPVSVAIRKLVKLQDIDELVDNVHLKADSLVKEATKMASELKE